MSNLTWGELKRIAEENGVTDSMAIDFIDIGAFTRAENLYVLVKGQSIAIPG
jgi:hypothetical protein